MKIKILYRYYLIRKGQAMNCKMEDFWGPLLAKNRSIYSRRYDFVNKIRKRSHVERLAKNTR